jgi:uncharacterized protein YqgQ
MKFYLATKNEILSFASKRMELKNIILSEVSQAQKSHVLPHADYRLKANAVILLYMDHILRREHTWEKEGKERKPKT